MKKTFALLACVLLVVGLAACNTDKGPAETAIKAGDDAITAAAPEAEKYVPDQLAAAKDALAAAKDKFAKGQYKEALAAGTELANTASALVAATAAKKDELTKAWNDLAASLPQTVASIQAKIEEFGKAKKLPKGMDKAMLAKAQEGLAGITKAWEEASAAFTAGNLGEALAKATPLKEKGAEVMALLGMAPAAAPAEAPAAAPAK
jgi:predicted small secreted protein